MAGYDPYGGSYQPPRTSNLNYNTTTNPRAGQTYTPPAAPSGGGGASGSNMAPSGGGMAPSGDGGFSPSGGGYGGMEMMDPYAGLKQQLALEAAQMAYYNKRLELEWAELNGYKIPMLQVEKDRLAAQAAYQAAQLAYQGDATALQAAGLLNDSDFQRISQLMTAANAMGNLSLGARGQQIDLLSYLSSDSISRLNAAINAGQALNQDDVQRLTVALEASGQLSRDDIQRMTLALQSGQALNQDDIQRASVALEAAGQVANIAAQQAGLAYQGIGQLTDAEVRRGALGLAGAQAASQEGLAAMGLAAQLRGPRNAFQQQSVMHGLNQAGLSKAVDAIAGKYDIAGYQAPQAAPEAASLRTLAEDMSAAGGQTGRMAPGDLMMGIAQQFSQPGQERDLLMQQIQRNLEGDPAGMSELQGLVNRYMQGQGPGSDMIGQVGYNQLYGYRPGTDIMQGVANRGMQQGPGSEMLRDAYGRSQANPYESQAQWFMNNPAGQEAMDLMREAASRRLEGESPGDALARLVAQRYTDPNSPQAQSINRLLQMGGVGGAAGGNTGALDHIWRSRPDLKQFYSQQGWPTETPEQQRAIVQDWLRMTGDESVRRAGGDPAAVAQQMGWNPPAAGGNMQYGYQAPQAKTQAVGQDVGGFWKPGTYQATPPQQSYSWQSAGGVGGGSADYYTNLQKAMSQGQQSPQMTQQPAQQSVGGAGGAYDYYTGLQKAMNQGQPQPVDLYGGDPSRGRGQLPTNPYEQGYRKPYIMRPGDSYPNYPQNPYGGQQYYPDASRGNPQPGQMYAQVVTPGQLPDPQRNPYQNAQGQWSGGFMGGQRTPMPTQPQGNAYGYYGYQAPRYQPPYSTSQAAYAQAMPAPHRIVGRNWMNLPDDSKGFFLSGYESMGYSPEQVSNAIQRGLPQWKTPGTGYIR